MIVPDQLKVVRAFRMLELMVVVDPFMTPTAKLAHYVFPTHLQYERARSAVLAVGGLLLPQALYALHAGRGAAGREPDGRRR